MPKVEQAVPNSVRQPDKESTAHLICRSTLEQTRRSTQHTQRGSGLLRRNEDGSNDRYHPLDSCLKMRGTSRNYVVLLIVIKISFSFLKQPFCFHISVLLKGLVCGGDIIYFPVCTGRGSTIA